MIGLVAGIYRLGVDGMRSRRPRPRRPASSRAASSTRWSPIALAYVVAHYFSLLAYQGQAMAYLVSDPLGDGSNLFGTATAPIDYTVIGADGVWYVQVAALVAGHVAGLMLAHDRALGVYARRHSDAARSQYWMLAVMVGFTSLGPGYSPPPPNDRRPHRSLTWDTATRSYSWRRCSRSRVLWAQKGRECKHDADAAEYDPTRGGTDEGQ